MNVFGLLNFVKKSELHTSLVTHLIKLSDVRDILLMIGFIVSHKVSSQEVRCIFKTRIFFSFEMHVSLTVHVMWHGPLLSILKMVYVQAFDDLNP